MAAAVEDAERRRQELIGDVAHEMRTPIATLEGYLEGLLDGVIEPSDRVWAKLHDEAGRLRRLIEDLQELSRAEAHQLTVICRATPPAAIVQPAVERLEADVAERGLSLDVDVPPGLPEVQADPERAIQVLTNLLTNALRYTPPPGEIVGAGGRRGRAGPLRGGGHRHRDRAGAPAARLRALLPRGQVAGHGRWAGPASA